MNNESLETQDVQPDVPPTDAEAAPEPQAEGALGLLQAKLELLEAQVSDLKEKNLRLLAEMDNLKKRQARELTDFRKFAVEKVLTDILPVLDSMDKAQTTDGGEASSQSMAAGFQMIQKQLTDTLQKQGLEAMETKGKAFDPNLHQAIQRVESADVASEVVLNEFAKGYLLNGRLLRAAMVSVAVPMA